MKQVVILSTLISLLAVAGCSSKTEEAQPQASAPAAAAPAMQHNASEASAPQEQVKINLTLTSTMGPINAKPHAILDIPVHIQNNGETPFSDTVALSYHLFNANGKTILHDGERTAFNMPIKSGESEDTSVKVFAPTESGAYVVEVDIVKDGAYWFGDKGMATVRLPVTVTPAN
jgi:hypothetical protein